MSTTTTNQDTYETESTASVMHLDAWALAGAAAVVSAIVMLLLGRLVEWSFVHLLDGVNRDYDHTMRELE